MRKLYFYLFFSISFSVIYAQEELKKPSLKIKSPVSLGMEQKMRMKIDLPDMRWESSKYRLLSTMNITDYLNSYSFTVNEKSRIRLYNSSEFLPGLAGIRKAGGEVEFRINESFLLQGGMYAMKYDYNFGYRPYYDAVTYMNASYRVNSRLVLGIYGRYSAAEQYNMRHGSIMTSPFVPHSGYGVSATTMFNEVIGIQGVIGREFNPWEGKWETIYDVYPVIDFSKLFK